MTYKQFEKWANQEMKNKSAHDVYGPLNISAASFYYYLKQAKVKPDKFIPSKIIMKLKKGL